MEAHAGHSDPTTDRAIPAGVVSQASVAYDPTAYGTDAAAQSQGTVSQQQADADSPYGLAAPTSGDPLPQSDGRTIGDIAATNGGALPLPHLDQQQQQQGGGIVGHGQQSGQRQHQASSLQHHQHLQSPYQQSQPALANQPAGVNDDSNKIPAQQQPQSTEGYPPQNAQHQSQQQQPAAHKVFCGGLSFQTDEDKLREYFERLGTVVDVVIMRDRMSGHPRGFGFVSFAEEAVAKDVASRRHDIDGRQVEAKIAIPRNQVAPGGGLRNGGGGGLGGGLRQGGGGMDGVGGAVGGSLQGGASRPNTSHLNKIFVGGLPSQVGESDFSQYFQQFGEVVDAQVMIDHQTGNSRGFGFISFADQSSVEVVVGPGRSSTRHSIMGKTVEVKRAEPKGVTNDRRSRDSYGAGGQRSQYGSSGLTGGSMPVGSASQGSGATPGVTGTGTYGSYNYPASVMEQYGQYYNNPQWQQYYANMGYNMQAYPQGFNPYTYYAAYMNNAAAGGATGGDNDGSGTAGSNLGDASTGLGGGMSGDANTGQMRSGSGGYGSGASGNPGVGMGGSASGPGASGSRRTSRRDDRYHPYR